MRSLGSRLATSVRHRSTQAAKVADATITPMGRQALRLGVASSIEHRRLLGRLAPATVLDVGANRGQFALEVRRTVPTAHVISFEPLPEAADVFERVFADDTRTTLHRVALASETGTAELHVSRADDSSSLLPISDRQVDLFPGTEEERTVAVPQDTLDALVGDEDLVGPVLLKLDVQGGELDVLRGATATLRRTRWVYVECSFEELYAGQPLADDVVRALQESGYALSGLGHVSAVDGTIVQADVLFTRR